MLAFFRKYEKTFFLIVFLPAIIGMGVTSVIVTVLTQKSDSSPGMVFGQPIPLQKWQSAIGPYSKIMGRNEEGQDAHFKFYAYTQAAEDAGIRVSDAEVADQTVEIVGRQIARIRAAQRIRDMGIDPSSEEAKRRFMQYFFEEMSNSTKNFTDRDYEEYLRGSGLSMQEFEGHQRRVLMQQKLEDVYREAATVSPEEIWKEFKEKGQKREAEIVTLDGTAYVPSAAMVPTDAEVKAYYESHKPLYDEPRRVALEYVAAPFEKTKLNIAAITEAQLKDYYEKHKADFTSYVGTVATVTSYEVVKDKISDKVTTQAAKDRSQTILEAVAAKLDEQRKAQKIDMGAAVEAVIHAGVAKNKDEVLTGTTPLLEPDDLFSHQLLGGFSTQNWANREPVSALKTSDPLRGEKCVCILRTADVKEKRTPTFDELREQIKKDYVGGGERELKKYYTDNQWKYRTKDKWKFEVLIANYESWAKKDPNIEVTADEAKSFWNERHQQLWPGKDAAQVGSDAITLAAKTDRAKAKATKALNDVAQKCQQDYLGEKKNAYLDLNKSAVKGFADFDYEVLSLDREEIGKDPRLSVAATAIPLAKIGEPSGVLMMNDGKGAIIFVVKEKQEQKVPDLAEIRDQVAKDVLQARGYERAKAAAEKLITELKDLKGDALAAKLKEKGLVSVKTGAFARTATVVPNVPGEVTQIVAETYNCEPGGGFEHSVPDDLAKKIYLLRCSQRVEPLDTAMTPLDHKVARAEILKTKRNEYVTEKMTDLTLRAKGISDEHVKWVRDRRDGPNGRVSAKVRQVFIPNDKTTLEGWLEDAARKRIDEALAQLKSDAKWDRVCLDFSEDEASKARGGELTVQRGDLSEQYGFEFENKLFELPADGQVSVPIKSKKGLHLIKVVKAPSAGGPDDPMHGVLRMTFRHILVKTDPVTRQLPKEVADKAREISKKKIEDAKARIEKGEAFTKVAAELGAEDDARAKGDTFTVPYISTVMAHALSMPVETSTQDLPKVEPFEVKVNQATEYHLALCARDPQDHDPSYKAGSLLAPRVVFECVSTSKDAVVSARRELETWAKNRPDHDPTAAELMKEWKHICERSSTAVSAKKQGAFGLVSIGDQQLRAYDVSALVAMGSLDAGQRSEVIETKDGFHYVECVSVETKPANDAGRNREVAEAILTGTDWADERP